MRPGVYHWIAAALLILAVPRAAAPEDARESYWGPLPEASDSTQAAFAPPGMPAWEAAIVWPYRVVTYPIKLLVDGLGAGVVYVDENVNFKSPEAHLLGFTPVIGFRDLDGLGGGLLYEQDDVFRPGSRMLLGAGATFTGSWSVIGGYQSDREGPWALELGGGHRLRTTARYFGLGPESSPDDLSYYGFETTWGGAALIRRPVPLLELRLGATYSSVLDRGPREEDQPALTAKHAGRLPAGQGLRSTGMTFSMEVLAGRLRREIRPRAEGQARLRAGYFDDWEGNAPDFSFARVDLVKWFPLWNSNQRIGFRGSLGWLETSGTGEIPFLRLLSNSGNDEFRGYKDYRFLDRGLLLTTAEYRWPLWATAEADGPGLDAILLSDFGQVFHEFDQVGGGRLTASWGGGAEYVGRQGLIRFTAARSREEWEIRVGAVSDLDAVVRRLVSGRSPVPER